MSMADKVRKVIRSFLKIEPPQRQIFDIQEELDFWGNAFANRLWYRGSASELNQFYRQLGSDSCPFWGSVPTRGMEIRKIHTGPDALHTAAMDAVVFGVFQHPDIQPLGLNDYRRPRAVIDQHIFRRRIQKRRVSAEHLQQTGQIGAAVIKCGDHTDLDIFH